MPPASTTPAFFQHGILVDGIVQRGLRHGDSGGEDGFDAAIFCGKVARGVCRRRETVRIVPSAGFMTAL